MKRLQPIELNLTGILVQQYYDTIEYPQRVNWGDKLGHFSDNRYNLMTLLRLQLRQTEEV